MCVCVCVRERVKDEVGAVLAGVDLAVDGREMKTASHWARLSCLL